MIWEDMATSLVNGFAASMLCLLLNIIVVKYCRQIEVKASKFMFWCEIPLITSALHLAGFRFHALETVIWSGLKFYDFIPLFCVAIACTAFRRSKNASGFGLSNDAKCVSKSLQNFMMLLVIQSALPVLVFLTPLLAALGEFLNFGIIPVAGFLFLFGPGSLFYCVSLGKGASVNIGKLTLTPLKLVLICSFATMAFTLFGIVGGILLFSSIDNQTLSKYYLIAGLMVLLVAYMITEKGGKPIHFVYTLLSASAFVVVTSLPWELIIGAFPFDAFMYRELTGSIAYVSLLLVMAYLFFLLPRLWDTLLAKLGLDE